MSRLFKGLYLRTSKAHDCCVETIQINEFTQQKWVHSLKEFLIYNPLIVTQMKIGTTVKYLNFYLELWHAYQYVFALDRLCEWPWRQHPLTVSVDITEYYSPKNHIMISNAILVWGGWVDDGWAVEWCSQTGRDGKLTSRQELTVLLLRRSELTFANA